MMCWNCRTLWLVALISFSVLAGAACNRSEDTSKQDKNASAAKGIDDKVTKLGSIEVTAKLVEVPDGAIFKRDLYDYATLLKYEVLEVHRGTLDKKTIFVSHYNPIKPRAEAADDEVKDIGGDLKTFVAGQVHRMALEAPADDPYMGAIVNKYFGYFKKEGVKPTYWAVWTNLAE